ncbi:hypothetical protein [Mesorhizobium sp.]|uniref:hypothetical protein n=1 Tax=Mesorhizobium sp. TaxID=1871066 RepID=UPI000FE836E9|nr:hypothetical protein [Mesorhizobium sp.]RWO58761.1 MAG: hypothetical protein EOS14_18905 [Mesorhizobium sp.]
MTRAEIKAELEWLLESYESLSASEEGERAVGAAERAEYDEQRTRAKAAISAASITPSERPWGGMGNIRLISPASLNRRRKIKGKSKHGHQPARRPAHRGWKAIRSALAGKEAGQGHTLRSRPQTHRFGSEGIEGIEREFFDPGDNGNIFAPDASRLS